MSTRLERLQNELANAGVSYCVIDHSPVCTAQEAAAVTHVRGDSYVKCVVAMADDHPVLLALPATAQVDWDAVCQHLRARAVRIAREDECASLFPDSEAGAMPPLPETEHGIRVCADRGLLTNDEVTFAAGSRAAAIRMSLQDYLRLAAPKVFEFARRADMPAAARAQPRRRLRGARRAATAAGLIGAATLGAATFTWLLRRGRRVFVAGTATGVIAAALADPQSGAGRRAQLRQRGGHYARIALRSGRGITRRMVGKGRGLRHALAVISPLPRAAAHRPALTGGHGEVPPSS